MEQKNNKTILTEINELVNIKIRPYITDNSDCSLEIIEFEHGHLSIEMGGPSFQFHNMIREMITYYVPEVIDIDIKQLKDDRIPKDSNSEEIQEILDTLINPSIAMHGGHISLAGYQDGTVYLEFEGGCHGCSMVGLTLTEGVEKILKENIPDIKEILDVTDHNQGINPFYE